MYFTGIFRPDEIAGAYAKDAVLFIFGVLAMAMAISKSRPVELKATATPQRSGLG